MHSLNPDVVVIGAGIAGLVAARGLQQAGLTVEVLEKSRGLGGRAATRTIHGTRVDHGAQFLTVRDPRFQREVAAWLADGVVAPWEEGVTTWSAETGWHHPDPRTHPRYAAPEGMNALGRRLAEGVRVSREATVTTIRRERGAWSVELEAGAARRAERVVVTAPVPQALDLLDGVALPAGTESELRAVAYAPCFAVMAGYVGVPSPDGPGVRLLDHPDLAWIGHDASKRQRPTAPMSPAPPSPAPQPCTVLVLHATPAFSRRRFDDPGAEVIADLLSAATAVMPWADRPAWTDHQRWRYAQPESPHRQSAISLGDGLVLAGDGFGGAGGGRVEGAYLSGLAAVDLLSGNGRSTLA